MPEEKAEPLFLPAKGRVVPLPDGRAWPRDADGEPKPSPVENGSYLRRRLRDGDLIAVEADGKSPAEEGSEGEKKDSRTSGRQAATGTKTETGK